MEYLFRKDIKLLAMKSSLNKGQLAEEYQFVFPLKLLLCEVNLIYMLLGNFGNNPVSVSVYASVNVSTYVYVSVF